MSRRAAALLALALFGISVQYPASSAPAVLSRGATGPEVRRLQRLLNQWLIMTPDSGLRALAVDGIFGPQTERTVRFYQRTVGLRVDGIVGPATWGRLLAPAPPRSPTARRSTPVRTVSTPRPTAARTGARPSPAPTPSALADPCANIPAPTNVEATDPNPLCVRSDGALHLYLKGFAKSQQFRYYIATPAGSMRGRPRIGHIGAGPLGNGLVVLASGTEFGSPLEPGNYVLVVEGLPNAAPRATAPFRLLP